MYGNGRPLGMRKRMQIVIAVVLLAWATQVLLHQWGFGAEVPQATDPQEKFVAGGRLAAGATLELRGDATVVGAEVKLRQVCRWEDADAPVFAPVADLVIARIKGASPFKTVSIDQIRSTLHDAGVNLAMVKFAGPISCTITRSDASYDEVAALQMWAETKEKPDDDGADPQNAQQGATTDSVLPRASSKLPPAGRVSLPASTEPVRSLRAMLIDDLSIRLGIAEDLLQVTFNPKDEKLLNLSEPLFKFNIEPWQVRDLGEVSWAVTVVTGAGSQKAVVIAHARAWEKEVVVAKPLSYRQVIRPEDVSEKRVLADRLPFEPLLASGQIVGQEAARDLKVGTVVSNRMVDAVPLVKPGQLVTISLKVGSVQIKTVGRAMESGCYGQTVKVRNDTTRDIFDVIMTGPQEGSMGPLLSSAKVAAADSR